MLRTKLYVLFLIFIFARVDAREFCQQNHLKNIKFTQLQQDNLTCKDVDKVDTEISRVYSKLKIKNKPNLFLLDLYSETYETFFQSPLFLQIPLKSFATSNGDTFLTPEQTKVHWVHELGHAIFMTELKDKLTNYADLYSRKKVWADLIVQLYHIEAEILRLNRRMTAEGCAQDLEKEICIKLNEERIKQQNRYLQVNGETDKARENFYKNDSDIDLEFSLGPYDELAADLTAIFYFNRHDIMSWSFQYAGKSEKEINYDSFRDFSKPLNYQEWRSQLKLAPEDPYLLLVPFKAFYFKQVLQAKDFAWQSRIYKKSMDLIIQEVVVRFKSGVYAKISPEEMNQRLINLYKKK